MAKHIVKCLYCQQNFDANSEPFIKPRANRYAHTACYEKAGSAKTQEEKDYEDLVAYITHLFGKPTPLMWKQIKEYKEKNQYTYSGMLKTLIWWYDIKHNSIEKAHGSLGIIPYIYEQASQYYYALYLAQIANEEKDIEHYQVRIREFTIEAPKPQRPKRKLFKFQEEEDEQQ